VVLVDGIRMLVNIVIVNPIRTYLFSKTTLFHGIVVIVSI